MALVSNVSRNAMLSLERLSVAQNELALAYNAYMTCTKDEYLRARG
jgi:hypothetical protein